MDIFKDLVEELKEENLLEQTVIETRDEEALAVAKVAAGNAVEPVGDATVSEPSDEPAVSEPDPIAVEAENQDGADISAKPSIADELDARVSEAEGIPFSSKSSPEIDEGIENTENAEETGDSNVQVGKVHASNQPATPKIDIHFYRQRAMDEVAALQMVEHVISGVEREQRKSIPAIFDDLNVKRALHDFLKIADQVDSPEHAQAEFHLMQETENWCSALTQRDAHTSVGHLRRYCETTKPSLSAQALISLARFYRNSPYSEAVRGKFDLVFTKLFSKDSGDEKRSVAFHNKDLVKHVQELYADWSSIPLYSTDEDDPELLVVALKFQDFIEEANNAESFDELIRKDFFKRLKTFKEHTSENFFAPMVVSAAIESNIVVGNRFVELIEQERLQPDAESFGEKYGLTQDQSVSEATGKTLELLELLQRDDELSEKAGYEDNVKPVEKKAKSRSEFVGFESDDEPKSGGVNKWLIAATITVFLFSAWFFTSGAIEVAPSVAKGDSVAEEFQLAGSSIESHVHSARVSKQTLFGVVRSEWSELPPEGKKLFLENAVELGKENGFRQVMLLDKTGKSVGYGSSSRVTVY